jgi:isocitrate dehydrogenase (NAD+)
MNWPPVATADRFQITDFMRVVLISGDGIGPEVSRAAQQVVTATGVAIDWVEGPAGAACIATHGDPLPEYTLDLIRKHRVALKGPCTTQVGKGFRSINVRMRQGLDLFASVRPVKTLPGIKTPFTGVDVVVVRENTEGLYAGMEHMPVPGVVESLRVITRHAAERIVRFAFELARKMGRRRVTFCHKADVLRLSDGLFLQCARQVADEFPFIEFEERRIDNLCMEIVLDPTQFDVLVMENLFGDVVSDIGAGLVGGLGLVPGANIGTRHAVFEAVHGSAPDIAGKGLANPMALIRSAAMMLDHIGQTKAASRIEASIRLTLEKGDCLTPDLGGTGSTRTLAEAVIRNLGRV